MTTGEAAEPLRVELVCTGAFVSSKGRLLHKFRELRSPDLYDKEDLSWDRVTGMPGAVYSVEITSLEKFRESGSIKPSTIRWVRRWGNDQEVQAWQAEARAASIRLEMERKEAKEKQTFNELRRALRPIRLLYARTNYMGKAAFIAMVVQTLMQDPRLDEDED